MTGSGETIARGRIAFRSALAVGVAGLLLTAIGFAVDRAQASFSYLAAFAYWIGLALGMLLFIMMHHAMNSSWFVMLRRPAEAIAATFPVFVLLFLPLLAGAGRLYPWLMPADAISADLAAEIERKRAYLNLPFFLVRSAAYFLIWIVTGELLRRWSIQQAAGDGVMLARRQRALSALMLPPVGFALTFAAFDWLMSLSPEWYSTVFGVYCFAGATLGALALLAVVAFLLQRAGALAGAITVSHYHALGKLMLTFLIFWAYIAFVQLLLIWIADLPEEVSWYVVRTREGWAAVAGVLVLGHFLLPLFALLSRALKRRPAALAAIAAWLLLMHYVDVYWLVLPTLHGEGVRPHWLDFTAWAGVGGVAIAHALRLLATSPLLPTGDPRFERSLSFSTE